MKRFLIPILFTLALPTAVNAEPVYLRCTGGIRRDGFTVTINENASTASVSGTTIQGFGGPDPSIGALSSTQTQFTIKQSFSDFWEFIEISRVNGSHKIRWQNKQFPSIGEVKSTGYCSKEEKTQTMF